MVPAQIKACSTALAGWDAAKSLASPGSSSATC